MKKLFLTALAATILVGCGSHPIKKDLFWTDEYKETKAKEEQALKSTCESGQVFSALLDGCRAENDESQFGQTLKYEAKGTDKFNKVYLSKDGTKAELFDVNGKSTLLKAVEGQPGKFSSADENVLFHSTEDGGYLMRAE